MQDKIFHIQNSTEFEALSLEIFNYQMNNNKTYSQYAKSILKQRTPNNIYEIPFLPIHFFKTHQIITKGRPIETIFLSSGTTGTQSKHLVSDISIYKNAYLKSFQFFYQHILRIIPL